MSFQGTVNMLLARHRGMKYSEACRLARGVMAQEDRARDHRAALESRARAEAREAERQERMRLR